MNILHNDNYEKQLKGTWTILTEIKQ